MKLNKYICVSVWYKFYNFRKLLEFAAYSLQQRYYKEEIPYPTVNFKKTCRSSHNRELFEKASFWLLSYTRHYVKILLRMRQSAIKLYLS